MKNKILILSTTFLKWNVLNTVKPGVFMASVGLKDGFLSIHIHLKQRKYCWVAQWVWSCNVNFYRTNKSSVFSLREEKLKSVIYVDDPYLQGDTCEECCLNIATSVKLLRSLHYTIRMQRNCFLDRQIPVHTKPTNDILGIFLILF